MPFTNETEYPRGIFTTAALTNVAQDVGADGVNLKVSHLVATGGAAAEIIIFRNSAGTTEYFRLPIGIGETIVLPRGFETEEGGLEALTASAAGDVNLTVFFFNA